MKYLILWLYWNLVGRCWMVRAWRVALRDSLFGDEQWTGCCARDVGRVKPRNTLDGTVNRSYAVSTLGCPGTGCPRQCSAESGEA
jgi:hypothetical protein